MNKPEINAKWLRLSEETNALDYLEKSFHFIKMVEEDTIAWKWAIIGLHGALYGFAICALKGTNPDRVTIKTRKGEKLIGFWEALKRCQDPQQMIMTINSQVLTLSKSQKNSIRWLKSIFRNEFEHFKPKGWLIEIHHLPQMAIDVLNIIRFLAIDSGNYIHLRLTDIKRVKSIVYQSKRILKNSTLYKEAILAQKNR